jgi:catechol 2,3-dioxygenase-like lactoylglutathione lyase family enzyme
MEIVGLDHVQLGAPSGSEEAARAFFAGLLCLRELPKPAALAARGGIWFQAGAQGVHVGIEERFEPARKAHPAFHVRGLDTLAERLAAAGVELRWDDDLPGHLRFYVDDPFGNRLELLEPR